jgi:hypothetical protein
MHVSYSEKRENVCVRARAYAPFYNSEPILNANLDNQELHKNNLKFMNLWMQCPAICFH